MVSRASRVSRPFRVYRRAGTAAVLVGLLLAAPPASAEPAPTAIRASIARATFDRGPSSNAARQAQPPSPGRASRHNGLIVAALATAGAFGGMFVASRVALPCHCDDPESVVARGALVGSLAGAVTGVVITLR